jgi:hypothetical protein
MHTSDKAVLAMAAVDAIKVRANERFPGMSTEDFRIYVDQTIAVYCAHVIADAISDAHHKI